MRWTSGYCCICWRTKQEPMKPQPPVTRMVSDMGQLLMVPEETVVESVLPRAHATELFELELAVGQHRIGGAVGGRLVVYGLDGNDRNIQTQAVHDMGGKDVPAGLPRVHTVIGPRAAVLNGRPELVHHVLGEGGTANLIVHDAQLVLLAGKAQDRAHEVVPCAAIHPGEAQDEVIRVGLAGGLLALQFGPAVDGEGTRGGVLTVGLGRGAIENVVGGEIDDACPCLLYTSPSPRDGLLSRMP